MKTKYKVYKGLGKRKKTYLVFSTVAPITDIIELSKKYFHCSIDHLLLSYGSIRGRDKILYAVDINHRTNVRYVTYEQNNMPLHISDRISSADKH